VLLEAPRELDGFGFCVGGVDTSFTGEDDRTTPRFDLISSIFMDSIWSELDDPIASDSFWTWIKDMSVSSKEILASWAH
jgi:hypothetical protein